MSWQVAAAAAAALALGGGLLRLRPLRRVPVAGPAATEAAIVLALFALWQLAGTLAVMRTTGALARAWSIWHAERTLHLPSEVTLQHAILGHRLLVEAANAYYIYGHFMPLIGFLAWTFLRHRHAYAEVRAVIVFVTGASLLIQLVPVAPPRMLPEAGFVDTGLLLHQSVYGPINTGMADQLSAMPSVHVAWAVIIAVVVFRLSPSRWRWLAVAHGVLMSLVVVVTANHFWADGLAAAALVGLAGLGILAVRRLRGSPARVVGHEERVGPAAHPQLPSPVGATDGL
jgi:hypothetical protein